MPIPQKITNFFLVISPFAPGQTYLNISGCKFKYDEVLAAGGM
jgi:hypothetical protein